MMRSKFVFFIFYMQICFDLNNCDIKTWNQNLNYDNRRNWNLRRLPCQNDRVIFGEENIAIFLSQPLKASQIVFPKNGQLIFGDNAYIALSGDKSDQTCKGTDIRFIARSNTDWLNPSNWNQTVLDKNGQKLAEYTGQSEATNPIPHSERVPCRYDDVIFPVNSTFKIRFTENDNTNYNIKSLTINGQRYSTSDFRQLLTSSGGKLFETPKASDSANSALKYLDIDSNRQCNEVAGCACGNDDAVTLARICSRFRCQSIQCSDPIKPAGHCCPICASSMRMNYKDGFKFDLLQFLIYNYQIKPQFASTHAYFHKLNDNSLQIIIVDSDIKGVADKLINEIKEYFFNDPDIYAIDTGSIIVKSSTQWITDSSSGWIVALVFFLLLLCLGAAVAFAYLYKRQRIAASFAFARFHGFEADRIELELDTTPHDALDPGAAGPAVAAAYNAEGEVQFTNSAYMKDVEKATCITRHDDGSLEADNPLMNLEA